MARKKPEAIMALEAVASTCRDCGDRATIRCDDGANRCGDHYVEFHHKRARENIGTTDLTRRGDESLQVWRKRTIQWLRDNAIVKRFGV